MPTVPRCVILVAEDDEDDRFLLTEAFARFEPACQLQFFPDGQQLLDTLLEEHPDQLPALILLDLNMPILDGLSTLRHLKCNERLRRIPVLMLTTSNHPDDVRRCYEAGANAYMIKPYQYDELASLVHTTVSYWLRTVKLSSAG